MNLHSHVNLQSGHIIIISSCFHEAFANHFIAVHLNYVVMNITYLPKYKMCYDIINFPSHDFASYLQ